MYKKDYYVITKSILPKRKTNSKYVCIQSDSPEVYKTKYSIRVGA